MDAAFFFNQVGGVVDEDGMPVGIRNEQTLNLPNLFNMWVNINSLRGLATKSFMEINNYDKMGIVFPSRKSGSVFSTLFVENPPDPVFFFCRLSRNSLSGCKLYRRNEGSFCLLCS